MSVCEDVRVYVQQHVITAVIRLCRDDTLKVCNSSMRDIRACVVSKQYVKIVNEMML